MLNVDNNAEIFFIQSGDGGNAEFINRQKNVFEKLDAIVKDTEKSVARQNRPSSHRHIVIEDSKYQRKQRTDTRQFRGQESIFKRPEAPPPARFNKRYIPDYQRHPKKWTKYTLSDVSPEDMSDRSNTAAAMTFLQELKAKKDTESMDVDIEGKVTFKKPSSYRKLGTEGNTEKYESSSFRSSKVIMPEYVVGEKKITKKITVKLTDKTEKPKEVKLDHLNEEDEF